MKTIEDLLKNSYRESDTTSVSLTLQVPLGALRENTALFKDVEITHVTLEGGAAPAPATKAPVRKAAASKGRAAAKAKAKAKPKARAAKAAVTRAAVPKAAAAAPKAPAAKKAPAKASGKAPADGGQRVTQEAVIAAIKQKNETPEAIAKAIKHRKNKHPFRHHSQYINSMAIQFLFAKVDFTNQLRLPMA